MQVKSQSRALFAVSLTASVCWASGMLWLCGTPTAGHLRWAGLLIRAVTYLLVAAGGHLLALQVNRRLFPALVDAPPALLWRELWPAVVWLPLLVLLVRESSPLVLVLPVVAWWFAASALRTWTEQDLSADATHSPPISSLFRVGHARSFARAISPAMLSSTAWHGLIIALIDRRVLAAGLLLATAGAYPMWTWMDTRRDVSSIRSRTLPLTAIVFVCLCLALLPYLRSPIVGSRALRLLGARGAGAAPSPAVPARRVGPPTLSNGTYSGVILLTPKKRDRDLVLPPAPSIVVAGVWTKRDRVIPFDGVYWYFKQPDIRPRPDAPLVKGDPTERDVRSTDSLPLRMEARQPLRRPLPMSCCRGIAVTVLNADGRPGWIAVEVRLHGVGENEGTMRSLGEQVLRTSKEWNGALAREPKEETLQFPFPHSGRGALVDEISVVIRPAPERALAGAHVAVRSFALVP